MNEKWFKIYLAGDGVLLGVGVLAVLVAVGSLLWLLVAVMGWTAICWGRR